MYNIVQESECVLEVEFKIASEEVIQETKKVFQEVQREAQLPGFRKGRVPADLVWEKFRPDIRQKTIEDILRKFIFDFITEKKISLAATPRVKEIKFEFEQPMSFRIEVERHPSVTVKAYKGIKVKTRPTEVSEQELAQEMKNWQERSARIVPSLRERVEKQHFVLLNYEMAIAGQRLDNFTARNQLIMVDNPENIAGLSAGLIGMRRNEKKVIPITFPGEYPQKELAGKTADLTVEVLDIKEKRIPEQDDELAKECGFSSLAEMRQKVKEFLQYQKEHENKHYIQQQIFDEILRENKLPLPPSVVAEEQEILRKQTEKYLQQQGIGQPDIQKEKEKMEEKIAEEARRRVALYYCLVAIADQENIRVSEEDLEKEREQIINRNNDKKEAAEDYFLKHKEEIASHLLEDKVIKFLVDKAIIVGN